MMHRASEQTAALMREDRQLHEEARMDEKRENDARQEQARLQVQLNREAMELRAREAELRAVQREEDRKQECQEALQLRLDEARRHEAIQAAQEKSRMVFETAMMAVISNLGQGGSS